MVRPGHDRTAPDALELLARAPDPANAVRLSLAQASPALKRARRCLLCQDQVRHQGQQLLVELEG
jgi:hypothetical protein